MSPLIVEWYRNGERDVIVVTTTTKSYTVLHLGHLDAAVAPPTPAPVDLLEFLRPPLPHQSMSLCQIITLSPGLTFWNLLS